MTSQPRRAKAQPPITPIYEMGSETRHLVCINQCQTHEAAISFEATFIVSGGINRATRDWKIKSCGSIGSDDGINSRVTGGNILPSCLYSQAKNA
jgi:hypothetical protein